MNFEKMKDFMDRLTAWIIPGNSVSVCVNNEEVFKYQSGYADLENKIPMTEDKMLNIYSCSKVATVVAALQLYERGFFLLDDPLYDFIPEYKDMYIKTPEGRLEKASNPITLRHLFTMTSGLTYNLGSQHIKNLLAKDKNAGTLQIIKAFAREPISFEPGEKWQYSASHDVLAAVVEVISQKKFRDYVKENIFEPLGMKNSLYHNDTVRSKMAEQYTYVNSTVTDIVKLQSASENTGGGFIKKIEKSVSHVLTPEYDSGGAGITTTVGDYSKFVSALANGGIGQSGEQILSSHTIDLLRTPQVNIEELNGKGKSWKQLKGYDYGLGVRTLARKGESGTTGNVGEFGWGGAAGATVLVDPSENVSVFYAHHMLNPQEEYYQPRLRNVLYACLK